MQIKYVDLYLTQTPIRLFPSKWIKPTVYSKFQRISNCTISVHFFVYFSNIEIKKNRKYRLYVIDDNLSLGECKWTFHQHQME